MPNKGTKQFEKCFNASEDLMVIENDLMLGSRTLPTAVEKVA